MKHADVIVIGAGVIGSSIAYELTKRGFRVTILDEGKAGQRATKAAAGMLGAQAELPLNTPLFSFAQSSKRRFPALQQELLETTGIDIELVQRGMVKLAVTVAEENAIRRRVKAMNNRKEAVWMDEYELAQFEPHLDPVFGGMYLPNDGHVNPSRLARALLFGATTHGATLHEDTRVEELITVSGRITGVRCHTGTLFADQVVVAGGAWSEALLKKNGLMLSTYPVKGECFSVTTSSPLLKTTVFTEGCYLVPKQAGRLVVGATETSGTFRNDVSIKGLHSLFERAVSLIPALNNASWEKTWAGIRPQTSDEQPYLGKYPDVNGLWIATGHYRNGILLSAETGVFLADLLEGEPVRHEWQQAFSPERELLIRRNER